MKKNILIISIYLLFYISIMYICIGSEFLFGSMVDYLGQHFLFLDYFRELFYSTGNLFPDFAFNVGLGQNIYYIAYYGLLSPVSLITYLFPMIDVIYLINIIMMIFIVGSSSLLYFFFKKKGYSSWLSFLGGFMLLGAGPLIFHAHRHIMFVNYFPFLILGLFGVDRFYKKKGSLLLIISLVFIIFSSYYYSVGSFITLFLYGLYLYLGDIKKKFDFKKFCLYSLKLVIPFLLSILISCILLLPIIYTLINGRSDSNTYIELMDLFTPDMYMLYSSYNMGLTVVSLVCLSLMVFTGKVVDKILAIILLLISIFPIFNYIFNGFIYINGKALIPLIPLVIILTIKVLSRFDFSKKMNKILYGLVILDIIICCLSVNLSDTFIEKDEYDKYFSEYSEAFNKIDDSSFYRTGNIIDSFMGVNIVSDIDEYKSSLYSSTYNNLYQDMYYNTFDNPFKHRNQFISKGDNFLYSMYVGEKYIISDKELDYPYDLVSDDDFNIYKSRYSYGLGFATDRYINSSEDFHYINLFGNIVSDEVDTNTEIKSLEKVELELDDFSFEEAFILEDDFSTSVDIINDFSGKVVFISFNVGNVEEDVGIIINNISNTLTSKHWKYRNNNNSFDYVLYEPDKLDIYVEKGKYDLSKLEVYTIDYLELVDYMDDVSLFEVDTSKTKGDYIYGNISVNKDSYLTLSIPYDEGFTIKDNGKVVDYSLVNEGFIGIELSSGEHNISIEYNSLWKNIGFYISVFGVIMTLGYLVIERKFRL